MQMCASYMCMYHDIYTCMNVHTCIYSACTNISHVDICTWKHAFIHACMYINTHLSTHACAHAHNQIYTYTYFHWSISHPSLPLSDASLILPNSLFQKYHCHPNDLHFLGIRNANSSIYQLSHLGKLFNFYLSGYACLYLYNGPNIFPHQRSVRNSHWNSPKSLYIAYTTFFLSLHHTLVDYDFSTLE